MGEPNRFSRVGLLRGADYSLIGAFGVLRFDGAAMGEPSVQIIYILR